MDEGTRGKIAGHVGWFERTGLRIVLYVVALSGLTAVAAPDRGSDVTIGKAARLLAGVVAVAGLAASCRGE
jgi:hypothetical protein